MTVDPSIPSFRPHLSPCHPKTDPLLQRQVTASLNPKLNPRATGCGAGVEAALTDATRLGFGDPIAISAETGTCLCICLIPAWPVLLTVLALRQVASSLLPMCWSFVGKLKGLCFCVLRRLVMCTTQAARI